MLLSKRDLPGRTPNSPVGNKTNILKHKVFDSVMRLGSLNMLFCLSLFQLCVCWASPVVWSPTSTRPTTPIRTWSSTCTMLTMVLLPKIHGTVFGETLLVIRILCFLNQGTLSLGVVTASSGNRPMVRLFRKCKNVEGV